jgi:hypothetical protein
MNCVYSLYGREGVFSETELPVYAVPGNSCQLPTMGLLGNPKMQKSKKKAWLSIRERMCILPLQKVKALMEE